MIPIVLLRSVEIFQGLSDDELGKVRRVCDEVTLDKEGVVFKENERADFLYTLVDGSVSLRYKLPSRKSGEESSVATIPPGSTFGWSGLHPSQKYTLTAYCTEENCTAIKIRAADLQVLLEEDNSIGYKVMKNVSKLIGDRFHALQEQVTKVLGQDQIDGW